MAVPELPPVHNRSNAPCLVMAEGPDVPSLRECVLLIPQANVRALEQTKAWMKETIMETR